jgi:Ser/Thr protein kinase RdoA (MazF antagonist)
MCAKNGVWKRRMKIQEPFPSDRTLSSLQKLWGIENLTFVRKMENIVFSGRRNGQIVFLRLTSPLRRSDAQIAAELSWLTYLSNLDLPVVKPLTARDGQLSLNIQQYGTTYVSCLFAEAPGQHPTPEEASAPSFLQGLGQLIARLHEATISYQAPRSNERREEWDEERGIRHALEAAQWSKNAILCEKLYATYNHLKNLPKDEQTYGLVHGDWTPANLFRTNTGKITIIDFDDSCYHFFAFDLAVFPFALAGRLQLPTNHHPQVVQIVDQLLAGYRKIRPLAAWEKQSIPLFMDYLALRLYFWIEYHQTIGSFHESQLDHVAKVKASAEQRATSNG